MEKRAPMSDTLVIESRFQGPPDSGNGGYVCGRLAGFLNAPAVAVRLHMPPPLDIPLRIRASGDTVALLDAEDTPIARARGTDLQIDPVPPPSFAEAEEASRRFRGFESHWFPSCFVCGPERRAGDGLRLFPGPIGDGGIVAASWVPDASLAPADGTVAQEFLWAALDCPGGFAFPAPAEGAVLLGELEAGRLAEVAVGERCVLVAWEIAHDGRKHRVGTALYGQDGSCRGVALATWIEVPQGPA